MKNENKLKDGNRRQPKGIENNLIKIKIKISDKKENRHEETD